MAGGKEESVTEEVISPVMTSIPSQYRHWMGFPSLLNSSLSVTITHSSFSEPNGLCYFMRLDDLTFWCCSCIFFGGGGAHNQLLFSDIAPNGLCENSIHSRRSLSRCYWIVVSQPLLGNLCQSLNRDIAILFFAFGFKSRRSPWWPVIVSTSNIMKIHLCAFLGTTAPQSDRN